MSYYKNVDFKMQQRIRLAVTRKVQRILKREKARAKVARLQGCKVARLQGNPETLKQ